MPSKYKIIMEMASQTARDVTSNAERFTDFLVTAANNYKYSFKEQLLIHAQKPDATACAEIETWNRLGRWVNKGTKGIALLVDRDVPYKLRHVFDVSDTNSRAGRTVTLWQMRPQYEEAVAESLQHSFGEVDGATDFPHLLIEISKNAVEDNLSDYLSDLNTVKGDSFLEELDETSLEVWLKDTLKSSVAFMALSRAGYDPHVYFNREDFAHIFDFNTNSVISVLGSATSDISEMVIKEIGETVKELEKEEKQKNRTFADGRTSEYHNSRNNNTERSNEHGTDLHDAGRLSDSRSGSAGEPESWEIWNAAANLPPRAQGRDLHRDDAGRNAEQPSGGSGRTGEPDDGQTDRTAQSPERSDRADEGGRSDEMGRTDEFDPSLGGGSSPERPDIRINLPTVEEQQEIIAEAEADKTSAFTISQEDIDAVLTRGSGVYDGKYRIYEQYLKKESAESNITFLKNEYGVGGAYPAVGDRNLDESHDPKGIKISRGRIMQPDAEVLLKWNKIEKRIGELIDAGRYLSQKEIEHYPVYRAQEEARKARWAISNEFRSIVRDYNDFVEQLGEEGKKLNLYYLSGCWGAFGVGDKKMHNRTAEGDFILPMMREAMNQIIADNTHLTERCEAMLESLSSDIAKPFEPTYDELNPPPEPKKEYRFSLGDTVYLGTQEYEVLSFDESEVVLFDTQFPLFNKTLTREEFDNRLKENPLNDKLLQIVEEAPVVDNTQTRISLDSGETQVHWIYYNPDAAAGGQYVSGNLDFSVFEELIEQYDIANHPENADAFRNDLEEMSDQFLADINTPFFMEAENDYEMDCDYIEFTPENLLKIHEDILSFEADREAQRETDRHEAEFGADGTRVFRETEKLPVYDRETEILYDVLGYLKIDDVEFTFDENGLVASDSMDNVWHGAEFYNFLVEDAFVFEKDGSVLGIPDEVIRDFSALCEHNGVAFRDHFVSEFDEYEMVKKENPDAIVMYKVGDFFEIYGERDTQIAHDVLELMLTRKTFTNKSITTPMCGFPVHVTEQYTQRLLDAGNDVVAVTHEPGEKLEVKRIVSTAKAIDTPPVPVGRIEHLGSNGEVGETVEYTDAERFERDIKDENYYGTPMSVVVYRNADGSTIPHTFISECDPPLQGFSIEDSPLISKPYIDHYYVVEDLQAVPLEIKTFSERDKAINEYFSLPTTKVKAFGVMNTNELPGSLDFIQCKDGVDTLTEDFLKVEESAGWQREEIFDLENYLKEQIDNRSAPIASPSMEAEQNNIAEYLGERGNTLYFYAPVSYGIETDFGDVPKLRDDQRVVIASPVCYHSDEFLQEYHVTFLKIGRDIDEAQLKVQSADEQIAAMEQAEMAIIDRETQFGTAQESQYRLLDRLAQDCRYYLGFGNRSEKHLWAGSVPAQIAKMRELYDQLAEKPEWITPQDIDSYEQQMLDQPEVTVSLAPPPAPAKKGKVTPNVLYPEIHSEYRTNFKIDRDDIGAGTPLERFYHNKSAIQLLKKLESEHRLAQPYEQNVLSEYVGWGGLSDFFKEDNPHYLELKELLTEDEYESARESTLTAFYTPPVVIKAVYQTLENMNFKTGNVLEPSCGIGNFMGLVPDSMNTAKFYGVELDSISGRIARQLYQNSSIAVQGFEETNLPDSFFDAAVGNVPFGQFKVPDKRYDKHNFLIHDYFFARTLDKVRPGGVVSFISSKGTMDKENPAVRKYIAQRADLLGAIRLPNDTFKAAAGTEVTSDIIFLQKRDRLIDIEPEWVHLATDENGVKMNSYFVNNPEMILGDMQLISGAHGMEPACIAYDGADLGELLQDAIQNIHAEITEYEIDDLEAEDEDLSIPADPDVRNFSFTVVDGKIYYRENSRMNPVDVSATAESRIKGMIAIRDCVRTLIEYQTEDYPDTDIQAEQEKLNGLYDDFSKKYGMINARANNSAFSSDSSYCLLSSLEVLDDEGNFVRKADMFTKRTIKQKVTVLAVDTASEAYALSLAEKAKIDMPYMSQLTGKTEQELFDDLKGVIFLNPMHTSDEDGRPKYLPADEYLSGNVREKLAIAKRSADLYPDDYGENVRALEAVQPVDLTASEISVRLGATWLPPEIVEQFMFELFSTPRYCQWNIHVHFSQFTGEWNVEGKSYDRGNVKAYNTYGTNRINGYKIMEETLNLKDVRIFDYFEDENGKKTAVLNKKETAIAQGKQELIKQAFADWIWSDPERRESLTKMYNEKFNSVRPREYDGSHMSFVGINPEITLRPHQVNAIAHILYGGNTLLAHVVGAGKTFEMVAAAQESKRLGLCQKSLFVVPNHLTEQWASEYLQLYPSANILVATKKDFETKNRKKFCGRIATGDYDAIIIGHSQFEKIPMSIERQKAILEQQLDEILEGISELKRNRGDNFSIKQLERTKKTVKQKLEKLNDQSRKDDVVTFEELGVDRIFIDEAHYYKNLAAFTKMRNVGGISQTEAMKSSDLYMKCRYLDELTGGRGVVFATGTPISNSMVEMYTMQKYLQYGTLRRNDLIHFDAWASTFGETVTAIELSPEGTGYRAKTRFAKFYNLPELMAMFKETADIQTADMLNLPVPEAHYHNIVLKPSETQKEMVAGLSERAERVRNKMVDSSVDNMLLITNDGRKLALDQRLMNDMLPDSETSKVGACADNVFDIWQRTADQKSTQMVFCDLSTPHGDGKFNVYDDLRDKLIAKGIPAEEIAYIHTANSEAQKKELFGKVRSGQVRVLIGSTQKMGAGTNVQTKLVALHHLDCPWRPSDLQQREGRIIRQGNENPEVDIYTYVTENTFDSYLYQLVESKQKFIGQIMTSKSPVRSAEDIDETALSYAEIKALCAGNPHIKEKMDLDIDVSRLKLLKANHLSQRYALEDQIIKEFPQKIKSLEQRIEGFKVDIDRLKENTSPNEDGFSPMVVKGMTYTDKKEAGTAIIEVCKAMTKPEPITFGSYRGFEMELSFDTFSREYKITLIGELRHTTPLGTDIFGNIQRLDNTLGAFEERMAACVEQLENTHVQLENAKLEVQKPFPQEEELKTKTERLNELNALLNLDKKENEIVDGERGEEEPQRTSDDRER